MDASSVMQAKHTEMIEMTKEDTKMSEARMTSEGCREESRDQQNVLSMSPQQMHQHDL
jgi:hypothetical protein